VFSAVVVVVDVVVVAVVDVVAVVVMQPITSCFFH
jgi:hypothetical protein